MIKTKLLMALCVGIVFWGISCDNASVTNQDSGQVALQHSNMNAEASPMASEAKVYKVRFQALNTDTGYKEVKGVANLNIQGDELTIKVNANGLQPGMIHPQHIHASGTCPSMDDDANGDGFLDVIEGVPSYGPIFVSLDADLADLSFQTSFPNPDNTAGAITYKNSVSVNELESAAGEPLDLEGRHLVLHGVSADTELPESVQSLGGLPSSLTLPVACGEVVAVN